MVIAMGCFSAFAAAKSLPENTAKIAEGVYSYGPGDGYYSMFVVTGKGVIAIEPISTVHAKGLLKAIEEVTDQPVKYLLHSHNHWDHSRSKLEWKT